MKSPATKSWFGYSIPTQDTVTLGSFRKWSRRTTSCAVAEEPDSGAKDLGVIGCNAALERWFRWWSLYCRNNKLLFINGLQVSESHHHRQKIINSLAGIGPGFGQFWVMRVRTMALGHGLNIYRRHRSHCPGGSALHEMTYEADGKCCVCPGARDHAAESAGQGWGFGVLAGLEPASLRRLPPTAALPSGRATGACHDGDRIRCGRGRGGP
jgi:hypothetical protein